jgi:hypothetical protein
MTITKSGLEITVWGMVLLTLATALIQQYAIATLLMGLTFILDNYNETRT